MTGRRRGINIKDSLNRAIECNCTIKKAAQLERLS
jgi:hypothetical protein